MLSYDESSENYIAYRTSYNLTQEQKNDALNHNYSNGLSQELIKHIELIDFDTSSMLRGDGYYGALWKLEDGRCGYINHVYAHPITNEPMATMLIVPCPQNQSVDNNPIFFEVDGTGGYSGGIQIIVYENPNGAGQVYNADEWQSMGGGSFVVTDGQIIYFPGNSTLPMVNYRSELIAQLGIPNFGPNARPDLYAWLNDPFNGGTIKEIFEFIDSNEFSESAKVEAIMRVEVEAVDSMGSWNTSETGTFSGHQALQYDATYTLPGFNGQRKMYRLISSRFPELNHKQVLFKSNAAYNINGQYNNTIAPTDIPLDGNHHYVYNYDTKFWYEFSLPVQAIDCLSCDLNGFFEYVLVNGLIITGRYFLPVEDVIILISGKDFEGVESSRAVAAGFLLIDLVPGSSLIKGIKLIKYGDEVLQAAEVVVKVADQVYRTQKAIVKDVLEGAEILLNNTRRGNFGEIVVDINIYEKGYEFINRTDGVISLNDTAIHSNGIDHIIKNPTTGEYILIETKYNTATLNQNTNYGAQMSKTWITHHLNNQGIDPAIAQNIFLDDYTSVLAQISPNGEITYILLDEFGQKIIGSAWIP